ncbi:GH3 auxin-responsive promoter [Macleaya cordata]|uniref:GH3 auxin-responsive promoter n=1 Tax=Macleaya cordata TaxID=56857 RepID=A0A200QMX8_MACCD|nr:GH3 auxin-responsive promoter [Macleaya cordata]
MLEAPKSSLAVEMNNNRVLVENSTNSIEECLLPESFEKALKLIEDFTTNADKIQNRVLSEILSINAHVEYLQRHGLDGHTDRETFKKVIPVITYEDIKSDINRIANGDTSPILCVEPITGFFSSSGTSAGERKLIPITKECFKRRSLYRILRTPIMNQYVPDLNKGKIMYFMFTKPEAKTPGGLVASPILTSYYKSSHFKDRPYDPYNDYTSPDETIICEDSYQSLYSQLLCGLYQNNQVLRVGAAFAFGFLWAIWFLQKHWTLLCNDIRTGTIDAKITDSSVQEAVLKILKPNPKLADFIEIECSKDSWQGIITRLWPKTKYVDVIVSGSMSQYIPTLDYYSNGLPIVSTWYGFSECSAGINLKPLCKPSEVSYTLIPTVAYFEFLPVERNNEIKNSISVPDFLNEKEQQELVDLVDVKLGQEYELVVTTYVGLYRYRVGDVLRVAGFKNKAPQFNFICRRGVVLSIDTDKTDEMELQNAVENSVKHLIPFNTSLEEYTSYADGSTIPGHYVVYWELINQEQATSIPPSVFEDCCLTIEESLNSVYRRLRVREKSVGPLEIRIVEKGSFTKLMDFAISKGASISQYKTPKCVKFAPIVELLNSRVISNYFSPKCPNWVPNYK